MIYKIWAKMEAIEDEDDCYEGDVECFLIGEFESPTEARNFLVQLSNTYKFSDSVYL